MNEQQVQDTIRLGQRVMGWQYAAYAYAMALNQDGQDLIFKDDRKLTRWGKHVVLHGVAYPITNIEELKGYYGYTFEAWNPFEVDADAWKLVHALTEKVGAGFTLYRDVDQWQAVFGLRAYGRGDTRCEAIANAALAYVEEGN